MLQWLKADLMKPLDRFGADQDLADVLRFIRMTAPAMKEDGARCLMGSAHSQSRWLRITLGV